MRVKDIINYFLLIILLVGFSASSCKDEEEDPLDFPPTDRGDVISNRILIHIEELRNRGVFTTYEFYAPNGVPIITDTLRFRQSTTGGQVSYNSKIDFLNDTDTLTSIVEARSEKYIVCYRNLINSNLQVGNLNLDKNGFIFGTEAGWKTIDQRGAALSGTIRITLNYIPGIKENKCDTGSRIIEANIPYVLFN